MRITDLRRRLPTRVLIALAMLALLVRPVSGATCGATPRVNVAHGTGASHDAMHHDASAPGNPGRVAHADCDVMLACAAALAPTAPASGAHPALAHLRPGVDTPRLASADRTLDPPPPKS